MLHGRVPGWVCAQCKHPTHPSHALRAATEFCPLQTMMPLQISLVRKRMHALGADTRVMGVFLENHDTDRFLSARSACSTCSPPIAGTTPLANACLARCRSPALCSWYERAACTLCALPSVTCNSAEPQPASQIMSQGQPARLPQCAGLHPPLRVHPYHVGLLRCFLSSRLGVAGHAACCVRWSPSQLLLSG